MIRDNERSFHEEGVDKANRLHVTYEAAMLWDKGDTMQQGPISISISDECLAELLLLAFPGESASDVIVRLAARKQ